LANIIPIDSSLPEKVTKSSLINKISIISEAKPLNNRAKVRLFSNIMLLLFNYRDLILVLLKMRKD